jgi:hypothetical protein
MPDAMAVPARRHVTIIELDKGYTVSMAHQILACESLQTVHDAVVLLLAVDRVPQPDPPQPPVPEPPVPEPMPVVDQELPEDEEEDDEGEEEEDDEVEDEEEEEEEPDDPQQENLRRLVTAFVQGGIDGEGFTAGLTEYCPALTPEEVNRAVLLAQGIDPARFAQVNGVAS